MTADDNYLVCNSANLCQPIQIQFSEKEICSFNLLLHFWNLHNILKLLKTNVALIADLFPKLWTAKNVIRYMSKKPRFRTPFDSQHAEGSGTLLKSAAQHFYNISILLPKKWSWKMSHLVISEILGLFVNTLNPDNKYSLRISENLWQTIKMQLSNKQKIFPGFFAPFMTRTSYFEHSEKKHYPHSLCISEVMDCGRRA